MSDHVCWIDDTLCPECSGAGWYTNEWNHLHPNTITRHLKWLRKSCRWSMLEALSYVIESSSVRGHTFCTSYGHPIPQSSYLPRKGDLSGTLS
jgi:hypothetical protein